MDLISSSRVEHEISYWDKYETRFKVPLTLHDVAAVQEVAFKAKPVSLIATCSTLANISIYIYMYMYSISPIYNRKPFDFLLKLIDQKIPSTIIHSKLSLPWQRFQSSRQRFIKNRVEN